MTLLYNPCISYLPAHCNEFVLCVLRSKGYEIEPHSYDEMHRGYDIVAYHPNGVYLYFIEVKCGPGTGLSDTQGRFKEWVDKATKRGKDVKYVVCQFDDRGRLIGDNECKKLLRGYLP